MRYWFIIFIFLPLITWAAGTEVHDPNANHTTGGGWLMQGCIQPYDCISDDTDDDYDYMYDNNNIGSRLLFQWDDTAVSDSIIDSVVYTARLRVDNTGCTCATMDSIPGQSSAIRQSSTITLFSTGTWENWTIKYTTNPDGDAWDWTDIDDLIAGLVIVAMINNKQLDATELWLTVYYHAEGEAVELTNNIHDPSGAGMVHSVSGSSMISGP